MFDLKGLRVLNTRPVHQAPALSLAIQAAGGIAIECPALAIEPKDKIWQKDLPDLKTIDKAIFISANAVQFAFKIIKPEHWPKSIQVIALGEGTAEALIHVGLKVDLMPKIADSNHMLQLKALQEVQGKNIILFKGEGGRTIIAETLAARGAILHPIETYKRVLPQLDPKQLNSLWRNEEVDIILLTSQQAMHYLFILFGKEARTWLCRTPCLVFSERLAKEAALLGIEKIKVTEPKNIIETLHRFAHSTDKVSLPLNRLYPF